MKNAVAWFEIPTKDLERAVKFYNAIFGFSMDVRDLEEFSMAFFPSDKDGVGGALIHHEWYKPSENGVVIYLNAEPDLERVLSKVESAGGKVVIKKKMISPEIGYMGVFEDTEGNRIALHSMK